QPEHHLLHRRVVAIEGAHPVGRRLDKVAVLDQRRFLEGAPPTSLMAAVCQEGIVDAESTSLGDAPRVHLLAAYAVPELGFAFQDESSITVLREGFRQCRSAEPSSYRYDVVAHPPNLRSFSSRPPPPPRLGRAGAFPLRPWRPNRRN